MMEHIRDHKNKQLPDSKNSLAFGGERTRFSVSDSRLVSLLQRAGEDHCNKGFVSVGADGNLTRRHYGELLSRAGKICGGLQQAGLEPGQKVLLQIEDAGDLFTAMWGCILAGVVPVPLNVALTYDDQNQTQKLVNVWQNFDQPAILTCAALSGPISDVSRFFAAFIPRILNLEALQQGQAPSRFYQADPEDVAVLFLTSGSTGIPKGVPQTHGTILAMVDGTIEMNGFSQDDVTLNWMSMDHAGSLVFLGVMGVALKCDQFHVPISYVLQQPLRWLDLIHEHRVSISWAPNFVFSLFLEKQQELADRHWDLSCMRFMVNAGEAIVSRTARDFIRLLQQHQLPLDALRPAFGMVETCSGITWSRGFTLENSHDDDSFVDLGPCIPGASVRIVDDNDQLVPEQQSGRLQLKGPSVFSGYHNQEELNSKIIKDGWLTTGDLAFLRNGHLFITGREKDIIILNGNNFYCHEIEGAVEQLPAITRGNVAACGVNVAGKNTEQLAILYHCEQSEHADLIQLNKAIRNQLMQVVGVSPAIMIRLEPKEFPRTAIGKIQRPKLKELLEQGEFSERNLVQEKRSNKVRKAKAGSALADQIAAIWCQVLELDEISYDDTFFELGGHSLLAFQVQAELEKLIGRQIAIVELFNTPTVNIMAEYFSAEQKDAQAQQDATPSGDGAPAQDMAIAVIGIACRLPGADGPEAFWDNLKQGIESISFYGADEAIKAGLTPEQADNPDHVHAAPVLTDIEGFDADFWKYSPREARIIDPQQRIFLETAWEAFEDAGYTPQSIGQVGVFASAGTNTYLLNNIFANSDWLQRENLGELLTVDSTNGFNVMITNDKDYLPTRVSYKLNLTGPSVNVQTACSSTLVAIHEACKSIRSGESAVALAGGCAAMLPQYAGHLYSEGMLVTPDGHCRAYDAGASGTIFGSGSGAVLLKRLDKAVADRDHIYAVIRGSAVTNDGGQKMGFTAPSMMGEYGAARKALDRAGVSADTLGFIEGHGTGTPLGDPIEVQALSKAIRHDSGRNQFCALGSVKTNIGHMGIASGIAGALKAVLAIKHKQIPATLHYETPNPQIDFASSPFFVNDKLLPWQTDGIPRRAGVNSLGIGGTNAHVIFEQAPEQAPAAEMAAETPDIEILPLAAKNPAALNALTEKYIAWLTRHPDTRLRDICFTAQTGREHFPCRRAFVAANSQAMLTELERGLGEAVRQHDTAKGLVFLFTGQGAQYTGMAQKLYHSEATFRQALDECAALFSPYLEHDLLEVIFAESEHNGQLLQQTAYTQPALFAIQVALLHLLEESGIQPQALIGHSIGEFAAAWFAGVFSLEDAVKLVATRGRLMQSLPEGGAMAAVLTGKARMQDILAQSGIKVCLAASNAPDNQVISADKVNLDAAITVLQDAGITVKRLPVSHAFHSALMEPMLQEFKQLVEQVSLSRPGVTFISTLTGDVVDEALASTDYWVRHVRETVNCQQAIEQALAMGHRAFVELGPHPVMCAFGWQIAGDDVPALWQPCLRRNSDDRQSLQTALAALYQAGCDLDWGKRNQDNPGYRVPLPTYPWQRVRHWIEANRQPGLAEAAQIDPLLGESIALPHVSQQLYRCRFDANRMPELADHRVFGHMVPPGAIYAAKMMRAAMDAVSSSRVRLDNLMFIKPMVVKEDACRDVQVILTREQQGMKCELSSCSAGDNTLDTRTQLHARAQVVKSTDAAKFVDLDALKAACPQSIAVAAHQEKMQAMHIELGASFDWLSSIQTGQHQALARITPPPGMSASDAARLHPGLIDAHWQVLMEAMPGGTEGTLIPFCLDAFICHALPEEGELWCHAEWQADMQQEGRFRGNIKLFDDAGKVLLETLGLELRRADETAIRSALGPGINDWFYKMDWQPVALSGQNEAGGDCLIVGSHPLANALCEQVQNPNTAVTYIQGQGSRQQVAADVAEVLAVSDTIKTVIFIAGNYPLEDAATGCQQFLGVIQALKHHGGHGLRLLLVTHNCRQVSLSDVDSNITPDSAINIAHAPLPGMAAALQHELSRLSVLSLDLEQQAEQAQALEAIATCIFSRDNSQPQLAWRQKNYYAPALAALPYKEPAEKVTLSATDVQLVIGGHGGLGMALIPWLADCGARTIVVAGRHAPTQASQALFDVLAGQGVKIAHIQCDVTVSADVQHLVQNARAYGELQSVFYLAGVLDDALVENLDEASFNKVLLPKLSGAWHLHQALGDCPIEFAVFFSSVASVFGSAGQAAYAAGNAALDALAHYRRGQGLAALTINWGPWSDVGMAANMDERHKKRLLAQGYHTIAPDDGLSALAFAMAHAREYAQLVAAPIEPGKISELPGQRALLRDLAGAGAKPSVAEKSPQPVLVAELADMAMPQRIKRVEHYLLNLVKDMLQVDLAQQLDVDKGLFDLGMDSMTAVEVKDRLERDIGCKLRSTLAFDYPTIRKMAAYLVETLFAGSVQQAVEPEQGEAEAGLEDLSEKELAEMLMQEIGSK
ncbi:type I polyketide synthase [Thalassomonas sp. RHCl1]|uniref:type I polyketide synthase n=1 Tax=Thalassomonas sp. RHCl1 TaxID=2995320 RepID=UPI00248D1591|nr:type I polyketide synthase [Thalassomonas sp. RHCl1]